MIFATVGNARQPFLRLVEAADSAAASLGEECVIQSGHTPYRPKHARLIPFLDLNEYDDHVGRARIVVAHAGSGSIIATLLLARPVIVMARRKKYGEHVNDHQLEIAAALAQQGRIRRVDTAAELHAALLAPPLRDPVAIGDKPPLLAVLEDWLADWQDRRFSAGRDGRGRLPSSLNTH